MTQSYCSTKATADGPPHELTGGLKTVVSTENVGEQRHAISEALDLDSVSDGVIQGAAVRWYAC